MKNIKVIGIIVFCFILLFFMECCKHVEPITPFPIEGWTNSRCSFYWGVMEWTTNSATIERKNKQL